MGMASAIRAGGAFVEVFLDQNPLVRGLRSAETRLKAFGKSLGSMASKVVGGQLPEPFAWLQHFAMSPAGIVTGFLAAAKSVAEAADEMEKMSQRTGIAIESLSALKYAVYMADVGLEAFEAGIKKMNKSLAGAAAGDKTATDAFRDLGLSIADFNGLATEEQFLKLADRIGGIANPAQRAAAAMEIFGKGGTALLPLFAKGSEGIRQYMEYARQMGWVMSAEAAEDALKLDDALKNLNRSTGSLVKTIGAAVVPVVTRWANQIRDLSQWVRTALKNNKDLLNTIFAVAAGIVAGGAAFAFLATVLPAVGTMLGFVAATVGALATVVGTIITPWGLIATAALAASAAFLDFTAAGKAVRAWFQGKFSALAAEVLTTFRAVGQAIAQGEWALAARIVWAQIKLIFQQGIRAIQESWEGIKGFGIDAIFAVMSGAAKMAVNVWAEIQKGFVRFVGAIEKLWNGMIARIVNAMTSVVGGAMVKMGESMQNVWGMEGMGASIAAAGEAMQRKGASDERAANKAVDARVKQEIDGIDTTKKEQQKSVDDWAAGYAKQWKEAAKGAPWNDEAERAAQNEWAGLVLRSRFGGVPVTAPGPRLPVGGEEFEQRVKNHSIAGTFSGEALFGLGGGGPLERIADEAERQRQLLEDVNRNTGMIDLGIQRLNDQQQQDVAFA